MDDIIKIAEECGFIRKDAAGTPFYECWTESLEQFAECILADERTKASEELALVKEERGRLLEERKRGYEEVGLFTKYSDEFGKICYTPSNKQEIEDGYAEPLFRKVLSGEPHH